MSNIDLDKIKNLDDLQKAKFEIKYVCNKQEEHLKLLLKDLPSNLVMNLSERTVHGIADHFFKKDFLQNSFIRSIIQVIKTAFFEKVGDFFFKGNQKEEAQQEEES